MRNTTKIKFKKRTRVTIPWSERNKAISHRPIHQRFDYARQSGGVGEDSCVSLSPNGVDNGLEEKFSNNPSASVTRSMRL